MTPEVAGAAWLTCLILGGSLALLGATTDTEPVTLVGLALLWICIGTAVLAMLIVIWSDALL